MTMSTILHLGAGRCRELPDYLAEGPARIVLVEADPDQARELERHVEGEETVEVVAAAVAPTPGTPRFKRFNLRALNSLRPPTGLYDLYPGLRLHDEIDVEALTPQMLIEPRGLRSGQGNRLVIDTPGEESAIVHALLESGDLAAFDRIDLHCGTQTLYEGNDDATAVLQRLEQAGYDIEARDDVTDPERPRWSLRRNTLKLENQDLKKQLAEALAARDEQAKLASDRMALIEQLTKERDEAVQRAADRKARIDQITKEKEETANQASARQARIQELEAKLAELSEIEERQAMLVEEITRAEGQIDLIKDVLLREPGL